jgi:hypothetical protein
MATKTSNSNLRKAAAAKMDEFYTQLPDIEEELRHYKKHLKGKVVFCNCDDPRVSNFFRYFSLKFEELGLKKLITTCYKSQNADLFTENDSEKAVYLEYAGEKNRGKIPTPERIGIQDFEGDGDFRSKECIKLLKQADVVVTNPPFSLFREYLAQLVEYDKKFVIIGNKNALTYKEVFKLIKENRMWVGQTPLGTDLLFDVPKFFAEVLISSKKQGSSYRIINGIVKARSQAVWFTNLDIAKRHQDLPLFKKYSASEFPRFDNYVAINVDKTKDIPDDYAGAMGVPITFLDKYNPEQFEIIDGLNRYSILDGPTKKTRGKYLAQVNGKPCFVRIVIKNKKLLCKS